MSQFAYKWFNWFTGAPTPGSYNTYSWEDIVSTHYVPKPDSAVTVTFDSYPPKGWLGWCSTENCEGQAATAIQTGYEYNTDYYYFVYYATGDAYEGESISADMVAWLESFFVW